MLTADMLTAHRSIAVPAIVSLARDREAGRKERIINERDVEIFLATVAKYPASTIRVYANRGEFVAKGYKFAAPISCLEYWPETPARPAGACVSEVDAKRPHSRGPWVSVDGRREV